MRLKRTPARRRREGRLRHEHASASRRACCRSWWRRCPPRRRRGRPRRAPRSRASLPARSPGTSASRRLRPAAPTSVLPVAAHAGQAEGSFLDVPGLALDRRFSMIGAAYDLDAQRAGIVGESACPAHVAHREAATRTSASSRPGVFVEALSHARPFELAAWPFASGVPTVKVGPMPVEGGCRSGTRAARRATFGAVHSL